MATSTTEAQRLLTTAGDAATTSAGGGHRQRWGQRRRAMHRSSVMALQRGGGVSRRRRTRREDERVEDPGQRKNNTGELLSIVGRPDIFSYGEIKSATNNFNPQNILGKGGYGPVYKGLGENFSKQDELEPRLEIPL
uniref:Protein kinase domain-containing protein n=1 Tax=Oryza barthii TaxID=65489 RepID=A0A0D3GXB2_9ORYZ